MNHQEINTIEDLANYLRCDLLFLQKAIDEEYFVYDLKNYTLQEQLLDFKRKDIKVFKFDIKKKGKSKGYRTVYNIRTQQLSDSLKILNNYFSQIYFPLDCVHGFVKGKNIKSNANSHLAADNILSVDIKDYFESISKDMIVKNLIRIGFKENVAMWISALTTINGILIQGFCTSPTIANIVTHNLDYQLLQICGDKIKYTRYADDLYFSSEKMETLPLQEIITIIENYGFLLNENKTKFMKRGQQQFVTGLTVFDSKTARISKNRKRNIRLEVYYICKFGLKKHAENRLIKNGIDPSTSDFLPKLSDEISSTLNRITGWLHFINSIEPDFTNKYYNKLHKIK